MYRILLWNQNLNLLEVKLIVVLWTDAKYNITKAPVAKGFTESVIEILCQVLLAEINIAPMPRLYSTTQWCADKLFKFLLIELVHKFQTIWPSHDSNLPTCGGEITHRWNTVYNQRLTAYRFLNGLMLIPGDAKDVKFLGIKYVMTLWHPNICRKIFSPLTCWMIDNVNPYVKPRH